MTRRRQRRERIAMNRQRRAIQLAYRQYCRWRNAREYGLRDAISSAVFALAGVQLEWQTDAPEHLDPGLEAALYRTFVGSKRLA